MKQPELRQIIREEIQKILFEADIKQDVKELADELVSKGILDKAYVTSTGSGAKGKNKIIGITTEYSSFDKMNKVIQDNYKKAGDTALASGVYTNNKVHFYFYQNGTNEFHFLVRRKNYKHR